MLTTLNVNKTLTAIDGEKLNVIFKGFHEENELQSVNEGDFMGIISIKYPVADLQVSMTLDVFKGTCTEHELESGVFKVPFVDELVSIYSLEYDAYHQLSFENWEYEDKESVKCSCGGEIIPMYEEFPNWIKLCNKCDVRIEYPEFSPIFEIS